VFNYTEIKIKKTCHQMLDVT